jgi:monofunctional biosynthetic peptidoglycan transglycosylase
MAGAVMSNARLLFLKALSINFILVSAAMGNPDNSSSNQLTLFDFQAPAELSDWIIVNDGVMGGLSHSKIGLSGDGAAVFQGAVSLENNGGFSSTRTVPRAYGLDDYEGVVLSVKGDGKKYQFRIRTNDRFDGISYRCHFETEAGKWITVRVPFEECIPVFRGRVLNDVGPVSPKQIQQIGFLISDKQEGEFKLEIKWIKAYK